MSNENPIIVYRVIGNGTHIQPLEHIESKRGGWHTYKILQPDPMAGETFKTQAWYAAMSPMAAVLLELGNSASRLRVLTMCLAVRDENARRWRDEADEELKTHTALLLQAQMLASQAGLMRGGAA